ncbi:olfactory receptor 52K2-like [Mixophyes fleayi]|uniref:olfactory receptor 52K2-like n=1 Tax=Mixophyes fleayi TaxID=3061075 RepID=UPI003F4DA3FA
MDLFIASTNVSLSHRDFLLIGFPSITHHRRLLLIPFLIIYIMILLINCLLTYRIVVEKSLQSPMYFLIGLLFVVNLSCATTFMPKFLLGLAFDLNQISLAGCLVQMWFIYVIATFESTVILLMALDRYVAICKPLRYHDIMTMRFLVQLTLASLARAVILMTPIVFLDSRIHYCNSNIILHFACENMGLLKLACGDISKIQAIGLIVRMMITVVDGSLIFISYMIIIHTVMFVIKNARSKALNTCSSHVILALVIYANSVSSGLINRLETSVSVDVQNLTSAMYYLLPATINPIVYGVRVKEIRVSLERTFGCKESGIRIAQSNRQGE